MNIDEYEKNLIEIQSARVKEWKEKNNLNNLKEGYESIFVDAVYLQDMFNHKIKTFKKKNNCDLIINIVNGEIKIGALIDVDKIKKL
jgi:hypothetical protein